MKSFVKRTLYRLGFELRKVNAYHSLPVSLAWHCRNEGIDLCFDVGAATGAFATELRRAGYEGTTLSFEPLPAVHQLLSARAKGDPRWLVAERMALGAEPGVAHINVAGNSDSSSLLPMLDAHSDVVPTSAYVRTEETPVGTLDGYVAAQGLARNFNRYCLKIDTQGFEGHVLDGASETLSKVGLLLVEASLVPLYEGAPDFMGLYNRISKLGFQAIHMAPAFFDAEARRLLQIDMLFSR